MSENNSNDAVIDVTVGHNQVRIEGSEEFVSEELSAILDGIELQNQSNVMPTDGGETVQANLGDSTPIQQSTATTDDSELASVANSLGVSTAQLERYFFVEDGDLLIENPLNISPKHALLGYCTIENERTGKMTFENLPMKEKLVSEQGVEIDDWGDFIYNARRRGDIRDDPDTDRSRNKPFRLTRDGRESFIDWLEVNAE